ncbi:MAG: zinc ribbon domain-containing protein [Gemmatimonadetes bacterium]|nr:zinc ribbon domain-containing protein [Gemmatimonadota bacterium]
MEGLRPPSAPGGGELSVCPHCWYVNPRAARLCARCGADMALLLQESGGLRHTAPVQSPVPVRAGARLSAVQRALVLGFVALLAFASLVAAFQPQLLRPHAAPALPGAR